jgi:hypothetical protein
MKFWKRFRATVNMEVNITHLSSMEVSFVSGEFSQSIDESMTMMMIKLLNHTFPLKYFPRTTIYSPTTPEQHCRTVAEHAYLHLPAVRFEKSVHAVLHIEYK